MAYGLSLCTNAATHRSRNLLPSGDGPTRDQQAAIDGSTASGLSPWRLRYLTPGTASRRPRFAQSLAELIQISSPRFVYMDRAVSGCLGFVQLHKSTNNVHNIGLDLSVAAGIKYLQTHYLLVVRKFDGSARIWRLDQHGLNISYRNVRLTFLIVRS